MELQQQSSQFTCVGCGELILDQYVLRVAPDMEWHVHCLRCTDCLQLLDESCTCFVRDGNVYCKPDYIRLFGTRCAKCQAKFARNDLVMKARSHIFHVDCFRCSICTRQLVSGDEFALRDDARLLCKADHEAAYVNNNNNSQANGDDSVIDDVIVSCATNNNNDVDAKTASDTSSSRSETASPSLVNCASSTCPDAVSSRPRSSAINHGTSSSYRASGGGRTYGRGASGHRGAGENKTTRIRTVLNEKQLHTLRTCYSANSRPDALMKEQLVEMTGLSPRVIRVWFQNKRCKDKKRSIALKQLHQQQQNKGVPLIATSPVRHELPQNMQPTPVEVHKYTAPWNDFSNATSPDIDDVPSPATACMAAAGLQCTGTLPLGLLTDQSTVTATTLNVHHQLTAISSSESFADSFDDDTVVSFDDLPEVVSTSTGHRYVASAPPPLTDNHAHHSAAAEFSALEGPF